MPTVTVTVTVGSPGAFPSPADCGLIGTMLSCPPGAAGVLTTGTVIVIVELGGLTVNTEGIVSSGDAAGVAEGPFGVTVIV